MLMQGEALGDQTIAAIGCFGRNQNVVECGSVVKAFLYHAQGPGFKPQHGGGKGHRPGCKLVAWCLSSMPELWVPPSVSSGEGEVGDGGDGMGEGAFHYGESVAQKTMSSELYISIL